MSVVWPTHSPLPPYGSEMEPGVAGGTAVGGEGVRSWGRGQRVSTQHQSGVWAGHATGNWWHNRGFNTFLAEVGQ